jgi:hypothetical protein
VKRPFFAKFDPEATWLTQLRPAFGERDFFFERPLAEVEMQSTGDGASPMRGVDPRRLEHPRMTPHEEN